MPSERTTEMRTDIGPGNFWNWVEGFVLASAAEVASAERTSAERAGVGAMSIWTCILHFTSSIGVLRCDKKDKEGWIKISDV